MVTTTSSTSTAATSSSTISADVYAKVDKVMSTQTAGIQKINDGLTADQTKISALGQLQSALADFQSAAEALAGAGLSTAASSSTAGILTASTTDTSAVGSHTVDVTQLAQSQLLSTGAQASQTAAIGTGAATTIQIDYGTTGSDGSFTAGAASKSISIDSSNNTLQGIAGALQAAGINAQIVQGSGGYSLSIVGPSGAANSMRISVTGDSSVQGLVSYDPAAKGGLTQVTAAQDAIATVDGKQVTSASNTITGAITGTTLNLTGKGSTTVTVAQDSSKIAGNISSLATAYNALNAKIKSLQAGDLKSDTAVNQAASHLARILQTGGSGNVSVAALSKAGISLDKDGNMQVDSTKLNAAITADPASIGKLFTDNGNGIADQLAAASATLTGSSGIVQTELSRANTDFSALTAKKTTLGTALTQQATLLANLYAQQEADASSGSTSLFDMMA
jgi:flagellar hook-associated protein 2